MAELQNLIGGIVGRKGSGKSTLFRKFLELHPRVFIFDPMAEHAWVPNTFYELDDANQFLAWADMQQTFAGRFIPESEMQEGFSEACMLVYEHGRMTFGVEEVPMLCQPQWLPPDFDRIVRLGRHRRLNIVWTAQRMSEAARRLTAATDRFAFFSCTEPRDLDAIADRCGPELADRVAGLGHHDWIGYDVKERALV